MTYYYNEKIQRREQEVKLSFKIYLEVVLCFVDCCFRKLRIEKNVGTDLNGKSINR